MTKALGSEIKEFYNTGIPEGYFHDYEESDEYLGIKIEDLSVFEKYELKKLGFLINEKDGSLEITFEKAFLKWRKQKTTTTLLVEVNKDDAREAFLAIKNLGYKVVMK